MRCVLCMLTDEVMRGSTMPEVAVVGGYSLCRGHLMDWAASGVSNVAAFIDEKAVAWKMAKAAKVKKENEEMEKALEPAVKLQEGAEVLTITDGKEPLPDFVGDKPLRRRRGRPPKTEEAK